MSSEYIFEINDALYDHETGNVCMMPKFVGKLIRCKDCKYRYVDGENVRFNVCELNHNKVQPDDWYCGDAERRNDED